MSKSVSLGNLAPKEDLVTQEPAKEYTPEEKELIAKGAKEEKQRLLALIFNNKELATAEYKVLIRHTGGLVAGSMAFAYSKAYNDVIKLLFTEGNKNEESVQKEG